MYVLIVEKSVLPFFEKYIIHGAFIESIVGTVIHAQALPKPVLLMLKGGSGCGFFRKIRIQ